MEHLRQAQRIVLPPQARRSLINHCERKLARQFLASEPSEPKAYGVIAGVVDGDSLIVRQVFPLYANHRYSPQYKAFADATIEQHGVPSETAFSKRGWVADPTELHQIYKQCHHDNMMLFGNYHMHRVSWEQDPLRDSCTRLDTELAKDSGMWTFIVSMVEPSQPRIRAFFEGDNTCEAPVMSR
ncbi:MPN domain-containing protein [Marinobacter gelidimuriae]|uniref:hypothetical protein n=1 Tax=Marinobacter gelidimuriae TaxID=2739064 RepID=UPI000363A7F0|nr:hypothetical protein [Marinobacter gelidimuriae]